MGTKAMNKINVRIYAARGMSGRNQAEVVQEALEDKLIMEEQGIIVLCPVEKEHIKSFNKKLSSDKKHMEKYWPDDKSMIRLAHVFVNFTPHLLSQGVMREYGQSRYFYYKPCVHIFPEGEMPPQGNIAYFEDDLIIDDIEKAAIIIRQRWGTPWKRLKWKIKMLRKIPRAIYLKTKEWFVTIF